MLFKLDGNVGICVGGAPKMCAPLYGNIVPPPLKNPFFEKNIDTFFNYANYSSILPYYERYNKLFK